MKKFYQLLLSSLFLLLAIAARGQEPMMISFEVTPGCDEAGMYGSVNVIVTGGVQPYSYVWSSGGVNGSMTSTFMYACGNYSVTVTDATGTTIAATTIIPCTPIIEYPFSSDAYEVCPQNEATTYFIREDGVFVENQPVSPIIMQEKVCEYSTVTYRIAVSDFFDITEADWQWIITGADSYETGVYGTGADILLEAIVHWGAAGLGSVGMEFFDGSCQEPVPIRVEILPQPEASFATQPPVEDNQLTICAGQTVSFENTSLNATAVEWDFGFLITQEEQPIIAFDNPGLFPVTLTAYNDCGCADTTSFFVKVLELDNPNVDCVSTVCAGETVTYTSGANCGTFYWGIGGQGTIIDGGGENDNFITINWTGGALGNIDLQVDDCPGSSTCLAPTSVEIPIISQNGVISGEKFVCKNSTETYSLPAYEGTDFGWYVTAGGTITSGQGTNEITVVWQNTVIEQSQVISVQYDNCYLDCGGEASLIVYIRPAFYMEGASEVCENSEENYRVYNSETGALVNCEWQIQQDQTGIANFPASTGINIEWNQPPGTYQLIATPVEANDYCLTSVAIPIYIRGSSPAVSDIAGERNICSGQTYQYEATGINDADFEWIINDGGVTSMRSGNPITLSWQNAPPYSLSVSQTNPGGLPCVSEPFTIDIAPFSTLEITGQSEACVDDISFIEATAYSGIDYQWDIVPSDAGTIIGDPSADEIQILWAKPGMATVSVSGCSLSASFDIQVHSPPVPTVVFPEYICPDQVSAVHTLNNYAAYSWLDSLGNVVSSSPAPALRPGHYQVFVEDDIGCRGETNFTILPYPDPSIFISIPTLFCNDPIALPIVASDWTEGYQFEWYFNDAPIGFNNMSQIIATEEGDYQVLVTDDHGCQKFSNHLAFHCIPADTFPPPPGDDVSIDFSIDPITCNQHQYINESYGYTPGTIVWSIHNFPPIYEENPVYTYTEAGFYRIILSAQVNGGRIGTIKIDTIAAVANFEHAPNCEQSETAFTNTSTFLPFVNITGYEWDFGDPASGADNTSTLENPVHIYNAAGTYTVTLQIDTDFDCISIVSKQVVIPSIPEVSFAEPIVNCAATASNFIAEADPGVSTFAWDFGDPASGDKNTSYRANTYHLYQNPGTYTVTLTGSNAYGCSQIFSRTITIEPNGLSGEITPQTTAICEGDTLTLTAPAGGILWQWSNGETSESIQVFEEDIYEVTITDTEGCTYSPAPVVIGVIPIPQVPVRAFDVDENGTISAYYYDIYESCYGEEVHIEYLEDSDYQYDWEGETSTSIVFSADGLHPLAVGEHDIAVTVTDPSSGCTGISSIHVIIHPLPDEIEIVASPEGQICEGTTTTFEVLNPVDSLTYLWNTGEVGTLITSNEAGEYYVTGITPFGCQRISNKLNIIMGPDIQKIPGGCHARCRPDTICLPPLEGIVSYQWFYEGSPIPAPQGNIPELVINESGDYYVEMVSDQGCSLTSEPLTVELYDGYGNITGQCFYDSNQNGIIDAEDTPLPDIGIELLHDEVITDSRTTTGEGDYFFENILSTDYTLAIDSLTVPDGIVPVISSIDTALVGCDAQIEVNWLFECLETGSELSLSACSGETVTYNGVSFSQDTTFSVNYSNVWGCDSIEMVSIQINPAITITTESENTCYNEATGQISVIAQGGTPPFSYAINGNDFGTDSIFNNLYANTYEIIIRDSNNCEQTDQITIGEKAPLIVESEDQTIGCDNLMPQLGVSILSGNKSGLDYRWSTGSTDSVITVQEAGIYTLTIADECASISNDITVTQLIESPDEHFFLPNAFSPNGDAINETFGLYYDPDIIFTSFKLDIYDRWGNRLFYTENPDGKWDGNHRERRKDTGVYTWYMEANVLICGAEVRVKKVGDVALIR